MKKFLFCTLMAVGYCIDLALDNGLADPEIVYQKIDPEKLVPKCTIHGKPLDLLIVLDSSGSLRSQFNLSIDVVRKILHSVAISEKATRVALVQYSGRSSTYFHFNAYNRRYLILRVLDSLQPTFGLTRTGRALQYSQKELSMKYGMRGPEVPKIVFVISDGRSFDHPLDEEMAEKIKADIENTQVWAYGTGQYRSMKELIKMTGDASKVIISSTLDRLEVLFAEWKGTEICLPVQECIPGKDQPLDLMFVVDGSDSLEQGKSFQEQVLFMHRVLNHVNVHRDVVRVAMVVFSSNVYVAFDFNRFNDVDKIHQYIDTLRAMKGTTKTSKALKKAFEMFHNTRYGTRGKEVPKMAIVLGDGVHESSAAAHGRRLVRSKDVIVVAVAVSPPRFVDYKGLMQVTDNRKDWIFRDDKNLELFEKFFMNHVNMACVGFENGGAGKKPVIKQSVEAICPSNSMQVKVRTKHGFTGLIYAEGYRKSSCMVGGQGDKETAIIFAEKQCGMTKSSSFRNDGYNYNISIRVQFHPKIATKNDKLLQLSCLYKTNQVTQDLPESFAVEAKKVLCKYTVHEFSPHSCVIVHGVLGKQYFHKWTCERTHYDYLVHDCYADSGSKSLPLIDSHGCAIDEYLMKTPNYHKAFVAQEATLFMFPGEDTVRFKCMVSLCDKAFRGRCSKMIPPKCNQLRRDQRSLKSVTKGYFEATFSLETNKINVLEPDDLMEEDKIYCRGL